MVSKEIGWAINRNLNLALKELEGMKEYDRETMSLMYDTGTGWVYLMKGDEAINCWSKYGGSKHLHEVMSPKDVEGYLHKKLMGSISDVLREAKRRDTLKMILGSGVVAGALRHASLYERQAYLGPAAPLECGRPFDRSWMI